MVMNGRSCDPYSAKSDLNIWECKLNARRAGCVQLAYREPKLENGAGVMGTGAFRAAVLRRTSWDESAAIWVLLQQGIGRVAVAAKFLLLGRMLGPAAVGAIGAALLALAIAEALSDTGLAQAIVQAREAPTATQLGGALTTLAVRGAAIGGLGLALAPLLASAFHLGAQWTLFALAAIAPLVRGLVSPAYFVAQRERRFRYIAKVETSSALVDCGVALGLAASGVGPVAALLGTLCADSLKVVLTWSTLRARVPLGASWSGVAEYLRFSRWIWGASVVNLMLNQFDKVIVARLLGPASLGAYQVASKLAQLLLADAAIAAAQYLFPTLAAHHREHPQAAARRFGRIVVAGVCALASAVIVLRALAEPLVVLALGQAWLSAVPLFRAFVINMAIGALIALLVADLRAIGIPSAVTHASVLQAMLLVVAVPLAFRQWGVVGVVWASTAGLSVAALYMSTRAIIHSTELRGAP